MFPAQVCQCMQMLGKSSPHKPGTPTRRTNSRKVGGDGSPREAAAPPVQENGNGSSHADDAPDNPAKPLDKRHSSSRDVEAGGLDVVRPLGHVDQRMQAC